MTTTPLKRRESDIKTVANSFKLVAGIVASVGIMLGAVFTIDQRYAKADAVTALRVDLSISMDKIRESVDKIDDKTDRILMSTQSIMSERSVRRLEIDRRLDHLERSRR